MGVPMVKNCCFCATLHTGTLIIGYVYTVWALLELTVYSLLVTLAPLGKDGTVSTHKFALYVTAADSGEMLEVESVVICAHLVRSFISVYCIVVVHSRHKQIMYEEDQERFQHSARLYQAVKTSDQADHAL
ncbi:putative conserved plasma membrane protein [Operophtera brumata]|uniref:Putative conserved plasma membrane protein n=1 Tax=Operophtera brumata TaxID=104452 RepID=A0A0L7LH61_OPEBR|nr:putative conserved plasma membrane protein [Operophtera brumata]